MPSGRSRPRHADGNPHVSSDGIRLLRPDARPDPGYPATFATALDLARRRLSANDIGGAHNLLAPWHAIVPVDGISNHPTVAAAAELFATILGRLGDYANAATWSTHAYRALERSRGADDPEALRVGALSAHHLTRAGRHDDAVQVYQDVHRIRQRRSGPAAPVTLCTAADLTGAMHDAGDCEAAHTLMADTIRTASSTFGVDHSTTVRMIIRHAVRLRDCGETGAASEWFDTARVRTRRDDRNLVVAVARIAQLPARPNHTCGPPRGV